ncbi:hypothetical protein [Lentzea sp. E54]|uniref:hypothetical protein n=1 Tax=Lentzea xerophila TaxID=3435883 RepID=UPI003DA25CEA
MVADQAEGMLAAGSTGAVALGVFVQSFAPSARMIVFGAIEFATAVVRIGRFLGYHVIVCAGRTMTTPWSCGRCARSLTLERDEVEEEGQQAAAFLSAGERSRVKVETAVLERLP